MLIDHDLEFQVNNFLAVKVYESLDNWIHPMKRKNFGDGKLT